MKKNRYIMAVSFLALQFSASLVLASPVKVWHEHLKGEPSKVRAEGVIKASPEDVWENLIRFNEYSKFMPRVMESFFISKEGVEVLKTAKTRNANKLRKIALKYKLENLRVPGKKWDALVFMVLDTPFPVENRWYVIHALQDETQAAHHRYRRCWSLVVGNINSADGCWNIEPAAHPQGALSRYEDSVNPGGSVPEWVTRLGATQTVPQIFRNLERVAANQ